MSDYNLIGGYESFKNELDMTLNIRVMVFIPL